MTWDQLAGDTGDLPLLPAVLQIARDEYPNLDAGAYAQRIGELADALSARLQTDAPLTNRLQALNHFLFAELGFSGNHEDFYDPRNCYLNDVLDRRLGIPISLAVIQIECARRVGVELAGVSFPGHFLVRVPVDDGVLVLDPYHRGRSIGLDELKQRARPHFGERDVDDRQVLEMLAPASNRAIVLRMLRNLKGVYSDRSDWERALRCADRLVRLDPGNVEDRRDRGLFYLRLGLGQHAAEDLTRYLSAVPDAGDAANMRDALIEAAGQRVRLH